MRWIGNLWRGLRYRFEQLTYNVMWWVLLPFRWVKESFGGLVRFVHHWVFERDWGLFFKGLPFLLAVSLATYVAIHRALNAGYESSSKYEQAADGALETVKSLLKDNPQANVEKPCREAQILLKKALAITDTARPATLFSLFKAYSQDNGKNKHESQEIAAVLLDRLAPENDIGFGPAHMLRGKSILARGKLTLKQFQQATVELQKAGKLMPDDQEIPYLLGEIYYAQGMYALAEVQTRKMADKYPPFKLRLAKIHALLGHKKEAQRYGEEAEEFFRRNFENNKDDLQSRLSLSESLMFLERFEEALGLLREGIALTKNLQQNSFRNAIASVFIEWERSVARKNRDDYSTRLNLLQQAIAHNPNEPQLFDRLMEVMQQGAQGAESTREFLNKQLAEGTAVPLVHLLIGTDAAGRGDMETAIRHTKLAQTGDQFALITANNLAWFLCQKDPPELETALGLANVALNLSPGNPNALDTRGTILAKMEKWEAALADLEAALPKNRNNPDIHRTLALVYEKLNSPDLSKTHLIKAKELEESRNRKSR